MSLTVYLMENHCRHCHRGDVVFDANVTHNLTKMAKEAGIYEILWRPDEVRIRYASELVKPLRTAVDLMRSDPPRFEQHDPPNGWGSYERFVPWVERYADACRNYPDAVVEVSR